MIQKKLTGTGVALVTPFLSNGEIDTDALRAITEHVISNGVDYLVVMGTTGESATLEKQEKQQVLDIVLEINKRRLPVVFGMGGNHTDAVIQAMKSQDFDGIDAILSVAPYYNKPNQSGLYRHFQAIANSSPLPVIIYNVPGRTGSNILPDTTLRLSYEVNNIVAVKEASGNFDQIMTIIRDKPDDFLVISGDDALTFPLISLGADGVISVAANAAPRKMADMVRFALSNHVHEARLLHYELLEFISMIFREGSPAGVKSALSYLGLCENTVRLPLTTVSRQLQDQIGAMMEKLR